MRDLLELQKAMVAAKPKVRLDESIACMDAERTDMPQYRTASGPWSMDLWDNRPDQPQPKSNR